MILRKKGAHGEKSPAFQAPTPQFETSEPALPLTVVYTTVEATLMALRHAAELAVQLEARIRILVMHAVPYPLPIDRPPVDPAFKLRHFLTRSHDKSVETWIDIRLCRDSGDCLLQTMPPQSLILLGSHRRFWFSREKQWERKLRNAGHHVILIHKNKSIKSLQ